MIALRADQQNRIAVLPPCTVPSGKAARLSGWAHIDLKGYRTTDQGMEQLYLRLDTDAFPMNPSDIQYIP